MREEKNKYYKKSITIGSPRPLLLRAYTTKRVKADDVDVRTWPTYVALSDVKVEKRDRPRRLCKQLRPCLTRRVNFNRN